MAITEFDDLLDPALSFTTRNEAVAPSVVGTPVTAAEISARLIAHNYDQLTDGVQAVTERAISTAQIHAAAIMARLGRPLDLGTPVDREVVVLFAIWELYLRVGHEAAGREYRIKARDLVIATYGRYPEGEKPEGGNLPIGAVTKPRRKEWP